MSSAFYQTLKNTLGFTDGTHMTFILPSAQSQAAPNKKRAM